MTVVYAGVVHRVSTHYIKKECQLLWLRNSDFGFSVARPQGSIDMNDDRDLQDPHTDGSLDKEEDRDLTQESPARKSIDNKDNDDNDSDDESVFLSFDISALQQVAGERLQKQCTSIIKHGEGSYHKVYLLTMDDGSEYIARVAFPTFRRLKMESEVATLQYVAEHTSISVPKIYAWDADPENIVGAEYMITDRAPGISLSTKTWKDMPMEQKEHFLHQVADIMVQLFRLTFPKIGNLYRAVDGSYTLGPVIHPHFIDDERGTMDLDRGPWATTEDYLSAVANVEISYLRAHHTTALVNVPGFTPRSDTLANIFHSFERLMQLIPVFKPKDPALERFCFFHADLLLGNFIYDGTRITVIDWEIAGAYPAWSCAQYPSWIDEDDTSVEAAQLRSFFREEIAASEPAFLKALDEGAACREYEGWAYKSWIFYGNIDDWVIKLMNKWDMDEPCPVTVSEEEKKFYPEFYGSEDSEESEDGEPL